MRSAPPSATIFFMKAICPLGIIWAMLLYKIYFCMQSMLSMRAVKVC